MSCQRLSLLIALAVFVWSFITLQTKDVLAQADSASPRDYGIQKEHVETRVTRSWLENLSLVSDAVPAMLGQLGVTMSMVHTCLEYLVEKLVPHHGLSIQQL